jgi:acyl carrier protein
MSDTAERVKNIVVEHLNVDAEMLDDDLLHALGDIAHLPNL